MMTKKHKHLYRLGFSVDSDDPKEATEQEILHALTNQIAFILDPKDGNIRQGLRNELDGPHDTFPMDEWT